MFILSQNPKTRLQKSLLLIAGVSSVFMATEARPCQAAKPADRPNIVIMFVDQLRWSEVGCYGNTVIRTPHLDRFASEGVRFTHAFTNFPSCSPARSTILSGRQARSNGVYANQNEDPSTGRPTNRDTTLPEALAAAGYTTAMIGKWHLTPTPQTLGFQMSWRGGMGPGGDGYMRGPWRAEGGIGKNHTYEGYTLEHQSELAADFMRQHRDKPFLLYLTPSPPHMPIASLPEPYKSMYKPADIPIRPNVWKDGQLPFDERWFKIYLGENHPTTLPAGINLRDLAALYYGQVTGVDDWVARVLKSIDELGLARNTIVLFTSDHGDLLGSHQLFNKNEHYDEAIRVPFLVRWPDRIKPTVQDKQIISFVDVMPTLLDLCNVKIPATVQGTSLAPVLLGKKETAGENVAYIETTANEGIRTKQFVYWCNRRNFKGQHLFDVDKDPYQMKDVIADPAYKEVAADLQARTKAWRERTPSAPPAEAPTTIQPSRRNNAEPPAQTKYGAVFDFLRPSAYGKLQPIQLTGYFAIGNRYIHPPRVEWKPLQDVDRYELLLVQDGQVLGATQAKTAPKTIEAGWDRIARGRKAAVIIRGFDKDGNPKALSGMHPFYAASDFDPKAAAGKKRPYLEAAVMAFRALIDYRLPAGTQLPQQGPGAGIHQVLLAAAVGPNRAYAYSFPVLHDWLHVEMCRALNEITHDPELKKQIRGYADSVGRHLLMSRITDEGYAYKGLIRGCADYQGGPSIGIGAERRNAAGQDEQIRRLVEPSKNGYAGRALVRLYELTQDNRYLQAAREMADVLIDRQLDDGSWYARADAKTGQMITEYSSSVIAVATFLDELNRHQRDARYEKVRDRAVRWVLQNPVKTYAWAINYDDGGARTSKANPFGGNLSNFDLFEFVRYLAGHPEVTENPAACIQEQMEWNDNHFTFFDDDPLLSFNPFYPCVAEQNNPQFSARSCWCPMDGHTGNWALAHLATYKLTKDRGYLDRAMAGGNTLTQYQMDNGATLTWMPDSGLGISYRPDVGFYAHAFWPAGWAISSWTWAELAKLGLDEGEK